jgi:predicted amidohydrolase
MPHSIRVAALQMDGMPAPTESRLQRAAQLIEDAASDGAELIVLPELFNTGMSYLETNYEVTESAKGETLNWLGEQAKKYDVHIAGSILLVDDDDTYNAAFLVAPKGDYWRYDKHYPYLWERAFLRDGHGITVAETSLGKIGLLIGWDTAHSDLWQRYAAKVDLMLVLNSVPDFRHAELFFYDGKTAKIDDLGTIQSLVSKHSVSFLQTDLAQQARWLRVPVISSGASGTFQTILPAPFFSVGALLSLRSDLWGYADKNYAEAELTAPFFSSTRIIAADGKTIIRLTDEGDNYLISNIEISDSPPILDLRDEQAKIAVSQLVFYIVDVIAVALLTLTYRRGLRRQWGAGMAKMDASTKTWLLLLAITAFLASVFTGLLLPRRKR